MNLKVLEKFDVVKGYLDEDTDLIDQYTVSF